MPAPVLQFKRGNAGVAGTVPALRPGEPAISLNNFDFFIGIDTSVANNKFFGSHRYWGREDGTNSLQFKLVDKDGTNYIGLRAPNTLGGNVTYVLPGTQGATSSVLTNDGSGNLTWASGSANPVFSGIATFTDTTDNTLGDANTGAVQIDGGLGVNKNVTVGAGLSVVGESYFIGTATFYGGQINLGDSDGDNISVAGEFVSNLVPNATNTYDLGLSGKRWRNGYYSGDVDITGNLTVDGNVSIGGTSVTLLGQDVFIENKDIVLGYTTSITPNDDSANHGGVAIASTVGTPLASFSASGINTLPDTYKQMMWFHSGTLGFGTDAFAFNYGVAIGTTNMANGVRLAVGSGVTVGDTTVTAANFYGALTGNVTGNASSADQVKTVTASNTNANYYVTFVDANNGSATNENVYTDDGIYYNPGTNTLTTQNATFTGNVEVQGTLTATIAGSASTATRAQTVDTVSTGTNTNYHLVFTDNSTSSIGATMRVDAGIYYNPSSNYLYSSLFVGDVAAAAIKAGDTTTAMTLYSTTGDVAFNGNIRANDGTVALTLSPTTGDVTFNNSITVPGTITGTATTATRATLIDTANTTNNSDYYVTFVDTLAGQGSENLRVGLGLSVNPSNGNVKTTGTLSVGNPGDLTSYIKAGGGSDAMYLYANGDVAFQQKVIVGGLRSSSNSNNTLTLNGLDATFAGNLAITGITTIGTGVGITQFSASVSTGTSTSSVPTSSAVIDYVGSQVGAIDLTLGLNADAGGPSTVNTSQTLTISGTASEVETSVSGQTVTVGLPDAVVVGTSLSAPTLRTGTIQSSNTGATAITITANDVQIADDLTVGGNLYVNGNTTQVNTTAITVEDRTIELGVVDGSAPSATTTWDLGVLFNYYDGSAKKSAVVWEQGDQRFKLASVLSADTNGTNNNTPQLTVTTFAPIEVGSLWVTDCAGTSQVISCTGSTRNLENITIDAGVF